MADMARVSSARGAWSIALALLWPIVGVIDLFAFDLEVARIVTAITFFTMYPGALFLGITSIVRASRQTGRPGRTGAIVFGWIGTVLSVLIGGFYLTLWIELLLRGTT